MGYGGGGRQEGPIGGGAGYGSGSGKGYNGSSRGGYGGDGGGGWKGGGGYVGGGGNWSGAGGTNGERNKLGKGNRRALPKFVPNRGGGEWGKSMRQQQQQQMKDEKSQREVDYFWQQQERIGGYRVSYGGRGTQAEERELFSQHTGNVGIDFNKYDNISVEISGQGTDEIWPIDNFEELWDQYELPDFLWENIGRCKYQRPTPIQKYAIPVALLGRDAMCCAQTGSGKTCAFLLPILSHLDPKQTTGSIGIQVGAPAAPKGVIMAPTRELCSQIHLEARKLAFKSTVHPSEVYGGVEAKPQLLELAKGVDIVTATPGRLTDFIDRGVITMQDVNFLVLDEADRMLDMGFEPQIREIVQQRDMPSPQDGRMTLMFSATFPKEIQKLARAFMRNYVWVGVGKVGGAVDTIEQSFIVTPHRRKPDELLEVLRRHPNASTLIFVAMKRTAAWLEGHLQRCHFNAVAIHGDMEQRDREASLSSFRRGRSTLLVATDVAARGLDIPNVSHVVNYDLPGNIEDYVHRIGRTGRIGNRGWATSFFVPASDGQHSNANIVKDLVSTVSNTGHEIPEALQWEAEQMGYKRDAKRNGQGSRFGGRDHRLGNWGAAAHSRSGDHQKPGHGSWQWN